jgi:BirA family biotin operon repressor/biotin-[acetyl-CoA-carboxylase] ligase
LLAEKAAIMKEYGENCITLGQDVVVLRAEDKRYGKAISIDSDGGLTVQFTDGTTQIVNSGEVSIRGMYGYI